MLDVQGLCTWLALLYAERVYAAADGGSVQQESLLPSE